MNTTPHPEASAEEALLLEELQQRLAGQAADAHALDLAYRTVESPVGTLLLAATEQGLVRLAFESEGHERILEQLAQKISPRVLRDVRRLDPLARQLDEYFGGQRHIFNVPMDLRLSTDFRRRVQLELGEIAYGQTLSYAQVAERLGNPKAVRAVGTACATNPLPIVLPCHRVLRADGSLGGYLGGLEAKRRLLALEHPAGAGDAAATLF